MLRQAGKISFHQGSIFVADVHVGKARFFGRELGTHIVMRQLGGIAHRLLASVNLLPGRIQQIVIFIEQKNVHKQFGVAIAAVGHAGGVKVLLALALFSPCRPRIALYWGGKRACRQSPGQRISQLWAPIPIHRDLHPCCGVFSTMV